MDEDRLAEHRKARLLAFAEQKFEGSKAALGRALGYRDGAFVGQMLRGERPITEKTVAQVHRLPGGAGWFDLIVTHGDLGYSLKTVGASPGHAKVIELENNPDYPAIRRVKLKAQAGVSGYAVEYSTEDDGPPIVFRADWYKLKGYKPDKMLALRVKGESMIPSMYEGDLIVINTLSTKPKQGIPFLVSYEGEICVKRMVRDDELWWLTSDNPDQRRYPRTKCNGGTEIIGEVVYRQTERV